MELDPAGPAPSQRSPDPCAVPGRASTVDAGEPIVWTRAQAGGAAAGSCVEAVGRTCAKSTVSKAKEKRRNWLTSRVKDFLIKATASLCPAEPGVTVANKLQWELGSLENKQERRHARPDVTS
jgi:hypothetical protein